MYIALIECFEYFDLGLFVNLCYLLNVFACSVYVVGLLELLELGFKVWC